MSRSVKQALGVMSAAGLMLGMTTSVAQGDLFEYVVKQGTSETVVTPIEEDKTIKDFYGYNGSSNTGREISNNSILFLYQQTGGELSLVMIHSKPSDGSGGRAVFTFSGVPTGTSFSVRDDNDASASKEAVLPESDWKWGDNKTDGGAMTGSLTKKEWSITIDAVFPPSGGLTPGSILAWKFLSGDRSEPISLDLEGEPGSTDLTGSATISSRLVVEVDIDIKPGSDPNSFNINGNGVIPVAINGSADFDVTTVKDETLTLNGSGIRAVGKKDKPQVAYEDWNGDGFLDLLAKFQDDPSKWKEGASKGTLRAELKDGTIIQGVDDVNIVP